MLSVRLDLISRHHGTDILRLHSSDTINAAPGLVTQKTRHTRVSVGSGA